MTDIRFIDYITILPHQKPDETTLELYDRLRDAAKEFNPPVIMHDIGDHGDNFYLMSPVSSEGILTVRILKSRNYHIKGNI